MLLDQRPVEPADLIVLAIGIVIAALGLAHLVAHQDHGHAHREQRRGQEVLHLPVPELLHPDRPWGPLRRSSSSVVACTVTVALAVRLIMLVVVRNEIVQGEAVVAGHEVHALLGLALLMAEDLGAADHPVAKRAVDPSSPGRNCGHRRGTGRSILPGVPDKAAHLVETGRVPGLGDQLGSGQRRARFNVPEHGGFAEGSRSRPALGSTRDQSENHPHASPSPSGADCR